MKDKDFDEMENKTKEFHDKMKEKFKGLNCLDFLPEDGVMVIDQRYDELDADFLERIKKTKEVNKDKKVELSDDLIRRKFLEKMK